MPNEELLSVFRDYGVIPKSQRENLNKTAENRDIYQFVDTGWLVTNRMKAWQGSVGISPQRGIVSGHYIVFRPIHQADDAFLNLLMRSDLYTLGYQTLSRGVRPGQAEIDNDQYRAMAVLLPPIEEQRAIVRWVTSETAQIDELIGKQNALIELLGERRKAVITRAVTKGLDPSVVMKESGIGWLGRIPGHWAQTAFKHAATLLPGFSFPSESFSGDDSAVRLLRGINVGVDRLGWDETVYWSDAVSSALAEYTLRTGDLVLGLDRPIISAGVRVARINIGDLPSLLVQRVARIRSRPSATNAFLRLILLADGFPSFLAPIFTGVSVPHLSTDQVGAFPIALPPLVEQAAICAHVDGRLEHINRLLVAAQTMITRLDERRSALITAAVTGKIDVRGAA